VALPQDLRANLDAEPVEAIVEYVAARLRQAEGHRELVFRLEHGHLRKTRLDHVEIGNVELERLALLS
jgi:hypothetical protein